MSEGKQLLNRLLSSRTKGELLQLFHQNPGLVDSPDGIARRIGRTVQEIEPALDDFTDLGIIRRRQEGELLLLTYNNERDLEVQSSIEQYFGSLVR